MPLTRTRDWAVVEYHDWLAAHLNDPFVWGENDCCLMAANAIASFTGSDLGAEFRGKYADRASAFDLIRRITGGNSVADAAAYCAAKYGLAEYERPRFAQRGDLVVANAASDDGTEISCVVHLNGHIVSVGERGLIRLPISAVKRAWKV